MLTPEKYYHIYNHAVANDNLFCTHDNYRFFLKKYAEHLNPVFDTFAYCLMPNHFHLAVRVKTEEELLRVKTILRLNESTDVARFVSKQLSNFFSSYTQAFNKQQCRKGTSFRKPFKSKEIDCNNYFKQLIQYIHLNPVHHGFADYPQDWIYSSYESLLADIPTHLMRKEIFDWFLDREGFCECHKKDIDEIMILEFE